MVVEEVEEDEASDLHCICSKGMGAAVSLKLRIHGNRIHVTSHVMKYMYEAQKVNFYTLDIQNKN